MKSVPWSLIFFLALVFGPTVGNAQTTASVCAPNPPPEGYIIQEASYSSYCANLAAPAIPTYVIDGYAVGDNEMTLAPYHAYAVGQYLQVCAVEGVPPGWTVTASGLPGTCTGIPGGDVRIQHTSCVSGDTNCYPPTPQISASGTNPLTVPYGQTSASLNITWSGGLANPTCVWYQMDDFLHHSPYSPTCGGTSGVAAFSVQPGHKYVYWIGNQVSDTTVWAKTPQIQVVQGPPPPPTISASPNPVSIPFAQTGSTTITWSAPGIGGGVCVWVSVDSAAQTSMVCGGESGTAAPDWIQIGHTYTFRLYQGTATTTLLTSVTVKGVSDGTPSLRASSNPVIIPYGQSAANYTLTWNAPGYNKISLYGSQNLNQNGKILCLGNVSGSGSAVQSETIGEIANLYAVPNQNCVAGTSTPTVPNPLLAQLQVTSKQGATPTLKASQNPVVIPAGQSSANYTLTWNAPGYTTVTLYGKQNLYMPGKILCLGDAPASGSATQSMSTGEIATLYMAAQQSCTAGAVVSSVPAPVLATLNLTAQ